MSGKALPYRWRKEEHHWKLPDEDLDRVFEVNAKGTSLCTKQVAPVMMRQQKGKKINIASISGMVTKFMYQAHYCASKAAVTSFAIAAAYQD